jgi:hypothetical protein
MGSLGNGPLHVLLCGSSKPPVVPVNSAKAAFLKEAFGLSVDRKRRAATPSAALGEFHKDAIVAA